MKLAKSLEVRQVKPGSWHLFIDGFEFPWALERSEVDAVDLAEGFPPPLWSVRIGILAESITGVDAFNEAMLDEADRARVRQADSEALSGPRT